MKIVNRQQFLALPSGVVFAKYTPMGSYDTLCCKHGTMFDFHDVPSDFGYQDLTSEVASSGSDEWMDIMDDAEKNGTSYKLDFDCGSRDGLFDHEQLFAVWEQADIDGLISALQTCVGVDVA